jgi:tetratricopeptide (TPR) repeat protein
VTVPPAPHNRRRQGYGGPPKLYAKAEGVPYVRGELSNRALLFGAALMLAVAVLLQVVRDRSWTPYQPAAAVMWLRAGPLAPRLALGYDNLLADVYWMRTVIYYGGARRDIEGNATRYDLLHPMLDLVTTLDPDFKVAYRFGAIFLTEAYPNGPGRPDQAIGLLQRGIARQPHGWEYMHDIAFVYYWWLGDYRNAASWFDRAAAVPGAPSWLRPLAATTLAEGGNRDLSRRMWRQMLEDADVDWIRQSAELRLVQLDALDAIDALAQVIERFEQQTGRVPESWGDLVSARLLRGVPLDPTGVPFVLDPATGRIDVAQGSRLWPLSIAQRRERP